MNQLQEYLQKYGYMSAQQANAVSNNLMHEDSLAEAIRDFQRFASINETGELLTDLDRPIHRYASMIKEVANEINQLTRSDR